MSICQTQIKILLGCERLTPTQSSFKKLVPRRILFKSQHKVIFLVYKLILLIVIVSLFAEKSHRSPSDLETRIAHRRKDTVILGFVRHKSNLPNWARKTRTTIQKYIQRLQKGQKTGLVQSAYFPSSRGEKVALGSVSRVSVKRSLCHVLNCCSCAKYLS